MKLFYDPETVALIGASATPLHPGNGLFQNLRQTFGDNAYAVNPRVDRVGDTKAYRSILDVPAQIDAAIIFIPARAVPEALEQCGQKGVRRVIIESGGFAETGADGRRLHRQCLEIARRHGIRVWGPNCMGSINVTKMKVLSFMSPLMWQGKFIKGNVSLVVQSGMLSAGFLMQALHKTPFGLSKVASIGNKMDVDEVDILEYLIADPDTEVIAMYLESLSRGRRFFELARATDKRIVVLKSGRTALGAKAAASHTAALAQDDPVLDAAFRQARVIRVHGMQEMMDTARCLGSGVRLQLPRPRVAVLSFSGGAGVVSSDELHDHGLELARLSPQTLARVKKVFPDWMDPDNPLDLYPGIEKHGAGPVIQEALEAALEDPGVDAVFAHFFVPPVKIVLYDYDRIAAAVRRHAKPFIIWTMAAGGDPDFVNRELEKRGLPVVDEISKGVRILKAMAMRK